MTVTKSYAIERIDDGKYYTYSADRKNRHAWTADIKKAFLWDDKSKVMMYIRTHAHFFKDPAQYNVIVVV